MTCRGSYEIIFLSFLIVLCHLQAKTYFYFNMNLHHEDERNACSKNHINITVFYPLFNAKNRRSLCLLVLPVGILLMSPYIYYPWYRTIGASHTLDLRYSDDWGSRPLPLALTPNPKISVRIL